MPQEKISARKAAIAAAKRARGPIKVEDLIDRVLATKGVVLKGATPRATIASQIYTEAGREDGQLEKVEPGVVKYRKAELQRAALQERLTWKPGDVQVTERH